MKKVKKTKSYNDPQVFNKNKHRTIHSNTVQKVYTLNQASLYHKHVLRERKNLNNDARETVPLQD